MKKRLLFLLGIFCITLLIFLGAKLVFMLCYLGVQQFTIGDMLSVMWHGMSLDLSTSLYVFSLPFLLSLVAIWLPMPKWVLKIYFAIIAIAMSLAFVADTSLYNFWHFKLDASCLSYLETPEEAMASVTTGYLVVRFVLWALLSWILYFLYTELVNRCFSSRILGETLSKKSWETVLYILLLPVVVIGIRGGLGESTTNIGQVYFSQNQFLNHSAVNPVFSFLASLERSTNVLVTYDFMDDKEAETIAQKVFTTESVDSDTLLNTQRPNIVIILLESCGAVFTELENRPEIMPNLNRLMHEGVNFTRCYANSYRTDRGTVCTMSGYPGFPTMSVMKMPAKTRNIEGLAKSLQQEGYTTSYIYGGDINFTNMRSYLVSIGFEHITWLKDYDAEEQKSAKWGVRDDITFRTLSENIKQLSEQGKPFLIGYSTLSSHEPWDVPNKELDDEVDNAFRYLDHCIGNFVEELKGTNAWDNLLLIMLPDHGITHLGLEETRISRNHIPLVWTGGAVKGPRQVEIVCAQNDLAATLLGQLSIAHDDYSFSRDVLSKTYDHQVAMHCYNNGFSLIDSTAFIVYDLDAKQVIHSTNEERNDELILLGKAILQTTAADLNKR